MKHDKRRYVIFLLLSSIFVVPILIALMMVKWSETTFFKHSNHGQLLQPPLTLSQLSLTWLPFSSQTLSQTNSSWHLVYIFPQACFNSCQERVKALRQLHLALGKDQPRVQQILASVVFPPALLAKLQSDYPELRLALLPKLLETNQHQFAQAEALYIIDPHNNVILYYTADFKLKDLYQDLTHLLKSSQIG